MGLSAFDFAVVEYARSLGVESSEIYERCDAKLDCRYGSMLSIEELLAILEQVKGDDK